MNRSTRARSARRAVGSLCVLGAFFAGCGLSSEDSPERASLKTFVGGAGGAYIALVTDGDRMSGFVTDGERWDRWFATADIEDDKVKLFAQDGSQLGEAAVSDEEVHGDVTVRQMPAQFEAKVATGKAGLFTSGRLVGEDSFQAGWITQAEGSELGTYDTLVDGVFTTHPAPPLQPTVAIPGFGVTVPHQVTSLFLDANTQAP